MFFQFFLTKLLDKSSKSSNSDRVLTQKEKPDKVENQKQQQNDDVVIEVGSWVAAIYDNVWYIGKQNETCIETILFIPFHLVAKQCDNFFS